MIEKETDGREPAAPTPEIPMSELVRMYRDGATLAEVAGGTGLGRFAVAYRLEKAGVERRNPGSPRKTDEEKAAFARRQLEITFGEQLAAVTESLNAGRVTVKALAAEKGVKPSTLATQFRRAAADPAPTEKPASRIIVLDLVDADGGQTADSILARFSQLHLDPQKVAAGSDGDLRTLGFTDQEIVYMREQLKKNGH